MARVYNIFQRLGDGNVTFVETVEGLETAKNVVGRLAATTSSEIVAVDSEISEVVFRINANATRIAALETSP